MKERKKKERRNYFENNIIVQKFPTNNTILTVWPGNDIYLHNLGRILHCHDLNVDK